ncbi:DUF2985 domain containing protein [Pyrenophora tritici-repentis]|nr:DUF2985 domain containing protein [Pyrenophora tritici-repentis]
MDKLRSKTRWARNRSAEAPEPATAADSQMPRPPLAHRNSSTQAVNEGLFAADPETNAQDFGARPVIEPPTSLESSVDAGEHVPKPTRKADPTSHVTYNTLKTQRARSSSAPNRGTAPQQYPRRPQVGREASIGIRRMPASPALRQVSQQPNPSTQGLNTLPVLDENHELGSVDSSNGSDPTLTNPDQSRLRKARSAMQVRMPFWGAKKDQEKTLPTTANAPAPANDPSANYTSGMVDVLDTLDPEVATLTSLTNMQNSLFIPNLPFLNRRPTYNLRRRKSAEESLEINRILRPALAAQAEEQHAPPRLQRSETEGTTTTMMTIDSQLSDSRFAVLPEDTDLSGWSVADKKEVNDHVRHMLHSRRSRMKRSLKGFGHYVRRPLGFLVTLYAFLITAFGLAWVLFLIGWANVGDTYHMIYIAHYHHFTWSRRKKEMLPDLTDHNDLPAEHAPVSGPRVTDPSDPEKQWEFTVLTPKQQEKLEHHQSKFCKSHSFYKPHETETHYAFPLRFLVAIVVLLDCHSLLQISLGACTWGIYYKRRPFAITTVILCCSIACNATAGLLIWLGDKRTRKTDVLERMNRQELTEEAIKERER